MIGFRARIASCLMVAALVLLLGVPLRAAVPAPSPGQLLAMRVTLHNALQRRIALVLGLTREVQKVLRELEGKNAFVRDERGLLVRLPAGRKEEEQLLIAEGDLISVAGVQDQLARTLGVRLARDRAVLGTNVARLARLLKSITVAEVRWWEKQPLVTKHIGDLHPNTPAQLRALVTVGHPDSIEELMGAVGAVDRQYLPAK